MISAVDKELQKYIAQLNTVQKKSLLGYIRTIFTKKEDEFSIEEYNRELEEAEAEIARGECYTNEQVMAMLKKKIDDHKKGQLV